MKDVSEKRAGDHCDGLAAKDIRMSTEGRVSEQASEQLTQHLSPEDVQVDRDFAVS